VQSGQAGFSPLRTLAANCFAHIQPAKPISQINHSLFLFAFGNPRF
jgi:hypothetical protein